MVYKTPMIFKDFIECLIVLDSRGFNINTKTPKKSGDLPRDFDILSLSDLSPVPSFSIPQDPNNPQRGQHRIPVVMFSQPPSKIALSPLVDRSIDCQKHLLTTKRKQIQSILNSIELPSFYISSPDPSWIWVIGSA